MHIAYDELKVSAKKTGKCQCGKRLSRSTTFSETENPFNKNEQGQPKSRDEIYASLKVKRDIWLSEPIVCTGCIEIKMEAEYEEMLGHC